MHRRLRSRRESFHSLGLSRSSRRTGQRRQALGTESLSGKEKEVASKRKELKEKSKLLEDLKRSVDEKKRERTEIADSRKEQWHAIGVRRP